MLGVVACSACPTFLTNRSGHIRRLVRVRYIWVTQRNPECIMRSPSTRGPARLGRYPPTFANLSTAGPPGGSDRAAAAPTRPPRLGSTPMINDRSCRNSRGAGSARHRGVALTADSQSRRHPRRGRGRPHRPSRPRRAQHPAEHQGVSDRRADTSTPGTHAECTANSVTTPAIGRRLYRLRCPGHRLSGGIGLTDPGCLGPWGGGAVRRGCPA
jgi:hypothetical protein